MPKAMKYPTVWDNSKLYKSDDDPRMKRDRNLVRKAHQEFIDKWKSRKDYMKDPLVLYEALSEYEELQRGRKSGNTEWYYWFRRYDINSNDEQVQRSKHDFENFIEDIIKDLQFFDLNLSKIQPKYQKKMLNSRKLSNYHNYLKVKFRWGKHSLSEKEEKIILLTGRTSHDNWVNMTEKFYYKDEVSVLDEKYRKVNIPVTKAHKYLKLRDDKVRSAAGKAVNKHSLENAPIATEEINSVLQHKKVLDELRGLPRPDSGRLIGDDIDEKFVDTLIEVVQSHNDLSHRYYILKAKMLGKRTLNYYDRMIEMIPIKGKYKYDDSMDLLIDQFGKLSPKFAKITKDYSKGRMDVYPKKGKRGGAYAASGTDIVDGYIMLNHNDDFSSITTLAHELGHGINHDMYKEAQTPFNQGNSKAIAEVASNLFQSRITTYTMENAKNRKQELALRMSEVEDFISSIFRQIAFYQIEMEWHTQFREKSLLSEADLSKIYKEELMKYLGPVFKFNEGADRNWVAVPHFRYFFYVYSYASGLLIAKAMQQMLEDDPKFIEQIEYFLAQGRNLSPTQLFNNIGIDIYDRDFWEKGFVQFSEQLDRVEELATELKLA